MLSHFTETFVLNKPFTYKINIAKANDQKNYADLIISFIH